MAETYSEQDELLKYEYTLASCYEAEYLLSLKMQEGTIYDSSCEYYDVFEIHYPNTCSNSAAAAAGGNGADGTLPPCEVDSNDCGPVNDSMETGENGCTHSDQTTSNGRLLSDVQQPLGGLSLDPCQVAEVGPAAVQNGQEMDPNLHNEGPSRKRICLHH